MNIKTERKYLQRITTLFIFLFAVVNIAKAQLVDGKVYNIVSIGNNRAMSSNDNCTLGNAGINTGNPHQQWLAVAGTGENEGQFALRNLGNGLYLNSSEELSAQWTLIPTIALDGPSYNYCVKKEGSEDIFIFSDNKQGTGNKCMHLLSNSVVCGDAGERNSQFKLTLINKTKEEIEAQLKKVARFEQERTELYRAKIYEKTLYKLFADTACTKLNAQYGSMSDAELEQNADYMKLPSVLRNMVKKVKNDNWNEKNANPQKPDWDASYARKFRVQLYEPYSDPHESGQALYIQPHSVLNNPTGIYASKGDTIYVMVEGKIKEGSFVYLSHYKGYDRPIGDTRIGTKLKEGLNIIPYNTDSINTFVCYTVETFKNRQKTDKRLSDYSSLKIHIEGGSINGYYNRMGDALYTADKNKDWEYYEARANMPYITILGKYQVLQLYKDSMKSNDGNYYPGLTSFLNEQVPVEDVIDAWDRLMFNQRLTLGVLSKEEIEEARKKYPTLDDRSRGIYGYIGNDDVAPADYSDHYRVHGMSLGQLTGYMVGSNGYSGYNISTFKSITVGLASKDPNNYGNIWGAAHEIGHQHQALLHMNGLKESSNNIFSNVAVWFDGKATSNMADGALENLLKVYNREDGDFFHTTLGVQMHLYYKLWLYYHLAGKNNKFYPRLFELLRKDPMKVTVDQDGAECLLHFYKMCCKASGEDLTEFFRAHCFFTPMKQRHVADYTSSDYTMTQEQVDAAIAEVKSMGYPLNRNIIFINDCSGKDVFSHDGTTKRRIYDNKLNADMGMYTDFIKPEGSKIEGTYTYHFEEGKIVMSGAKGGVGFLAYDDEGMLQAFSDRYSFTLSERARKKLSSRNLTFYVIDGAGNMTEIKGSDAIGEQRELLRAAMDDAKNLLKKVDNESRRVGFFHKKAVADLEKFLAKAEEVYDNKEKEAYISMSYMISEECRKIKEAKDSRVTFVPNSSYLLECQNVPNKYVYRESDDKLILKNDVDTLGHWLFEMTGENSYHIKNVATGKYMSKAEKGIAVKLVDKSEAATYHLEDLENNYFAIGCSTGYLNYAHTKYYVQGWAKIEGEQSRWRLLLVDVQKSEQAYQDLSKSADIAESLVRKVSVMKKINLQTNNENEAGYLYCNAASAGNRLTNGSPENGYNLLDDNINTYLLTETNNNINSSDKLDHYLKVDLNNLNLPVFSMKYTTRNADSQERPKTMVIEGSNDDNVFTPIMTITQGLPKHRITDFETPLLDAGYRYLRFRVTATYGGKTSQSHPYFSMSSFMLSAPELQDKYASTDIADLINEIKEARRVLEGGRNQEEKLKEAKSRLDSVYAAYAAKCEAIDMGTVNTKKDRLKELIAKTEQLMKEVADVKYEENKEIASPVSVPLQCNDENAKAYISSNADQNTGGSTIDGGGVKALLDNNIDTYYHSRWNGTPVNEHHHIMVKLSDVPTDAEFDFSYSTRKHDNGPFPAEFLIEQSIDGKQFTKVCELTKDIDELPIKKATKWNSQKIKPAGEYKYLRFAVTKSIGVNGNPSMFNGYHNFAMSEFSLNTYEYKLEINIDKNKDLSCVTDSLVIDAELLKVVADAIANQDASETMLDEQIASLQQVYDSLYKAKEASVPYNSLKAYSETPYLPLRQVTPGNKVGQWDAATTTAYNEAYARAAYLLGYKGAEAAEYAEALTQWQAAYNGLAVNQPQADVLYTVRNAGDGSLLYVDENNTLVAGKDNKTSRGAWQFVAAGGKLYMKSLHTSSFLPATTAGSQLTDTGTASLTLMPVNDDGQVDLVYDNASENAAGIEKTDGNIQSSGWYIDEAGSTETVGYDLNVTAYGYAGLYLDYAASIPQGMEAYAVSEVNGSKVTLARITGNIIPARTAVLVKAQAGNYRLDYMEQPAAADVNTLLRGSSFNSYVMGEPSTAYYLFGVKNGKVGLYKAWLQYNENGTITGGNENSDRGGWFKVSANKFYLPLTGNLQSAPLSLSFDESTTGIENHFADEAAAVIYDLQGNRVSRIKRDGLYIINGKKVYMEADKR